MFRKQRAKDGKSKTDGEKLEDEEEAKLVQLAEIEVKRRHRRLQKRIWLI